jgi:drug/metabolite transporter (DMT)-like permease
MTLVLQESPRRTGTGLVIAVLAAASFGTSGAFIKPLLEAGWSPAAAVTLRALVGGIVLLPIALVSLRGRWDSVWRARWRILLMASIGVAGTQLVYFAAIQRIPVSTAILIEYMAPLILVVFAWATMRRIPKLVVIIGSVVAMAGLFLVVSPGGGAAPDAIGLILAALSALGCAGYYLIAARPSDGLPPVAFAAGGLVLGSGMLGLVGLTGVLPFSAPAVVVPFFGAVAPWWVTLLFVGVISTGFAYVASITASEMLGSRLASFAGLLEVVAAAIYAWILLGEALGVAQLIGGVLILAGIAFVRSEKTDAPLEVAATDPAASSRPAPTRASP